MSHITQLITQWKKNDEQALNHLISIAYNRLHSSARQALGYYGNSATMQTTELVNELYLNFRQQKEINFHSAKHFFAVATLKLRQILNTRHEKNSAQKRHHGTREDMSNIDETPGSPSYIEMMILNHSLDFIEEIEPVNARIAELKLFWEFDNAEIADLLDISESSVNRKWKVAKTIIAKKIKDNDDSLH